MDDSLEILRGEITSYLKEKSLSPSSLEKNAGLRSGTLRNILYQNSKNPTLETLVKLATVMNISLDQLVYGSNNTLLIKGLPQKNKKELSLLFEIFSFLWKNLSEEPTRLETSIELAKKIYVYCSTYVGGHFDQAFAQHAIDSHEKQSSKLT